MRVQWVGQEDPSGCVVACFAMITGQTYAEAFAELQHMWRDGVPFLGVESILGDRGWYYRRMSINRMHNSEAPGNWQRDPWPPVPFAPLHLCNVTVAGGTGAFHGVVMLADGTILDPLTPEPRRLSDYAKVTEVVGLLPPVPA